MLPFAAKSNTTMGMEFCLQSAQDAVSITFNPLIIIVAPLMLYVWIKLVQKDDLSK